ncbi:MAG: hypothetical protein A3G82_27245 [Burkholderiales bacterium RIFCSPLOWO2_12_FULL_67_210]|nr:MAG: hypothetical protein A3G82_27245 [Burkholderiales bacterium RIFCSPLOWO2_12_FULL_67_210]
MTQRTDELERARRAAEAASTAKSDFLATMSHEIRTPMNGVIGVADVLMRSSLNPHQMELTGTIRESAFALLSIIDDILNYSKIEAGRMVLEQAPMNLLRLAEGACDVVHPMALVQGVRLHVFADPALPAALIGDAARVRQVIINLVGNAIKFSAGQDRPGRVALRLLPLAGGGLRLDVSDNGIGMSPEVQARIFQPFEQGESSTSRTYGGTGLGLVICQRLVDAMGGRIRVASTPGVGSSFSVELPLPAHGVERPAPVPHDLDGLECVLVLDDEALVQDWATYLSAAGAVVSRGEALPVTNAPVEPSAGTTVLILSVERQRLLQSLGQSLPPGLRTVLVRHAERGAPRFVQPTVVELEVGGVHRDELLLAVAMAAGRASALPMDAEPPQNAQAPAVPDPAQAAAQGCLILVAEDNAINRKVIRHQLELLGLASELVASGQDALDCWRADPGRYGLLLTDLHMPGLDGLLLRHLPDGVLLVDAGHRVLEANPRAEQLLGLPRNALVQRPLAELFNLAVSEETTRHLLAGDAQGLEWDYRHPDGSLRYLEDTARTLADGRQIRVLRDVARQREESNRLRRLSLAAEQASEAIVITDLAANIEYVNQAAVTSSGYSREELIGRNSRMLQSGLTPMTRHRKLWATLIAGRSWRGFLNNRRKDGSLYIEFATISPVRAPDGRVTHYLAVKEDITEKRRMGEDLNRYRHHLEDLVTQRTDELERARRAAEAASTAKSDFLATMSHEIRTPMNGVIGVADVLMRSSLNPHQMELTGTIRESAFALLSIIDDILNYSKIEAGRMVLEQAPMNLLRLAEGACDVVHPMALVQGVRLHVFADPALPAALIGDAARVRQVIINLVGNAIKFSAGQDRPGRVALRLLPLAGGGLRLDVSDNGIGMSPEVQARIFQPFEQGESSTSRTYGGTGLGLVICQRLVDAMGGRIRVASTPGVGSSFSVELPLPAHGVERPAPVPHDLDGLECVLVLDDEALVQDWATYLSAAGAVVSRGEALPVTNAPVEPSAGTTVLILSVERQRLLQSLGQSLPPGLRTVLVRHAERGAPRFVQPTVVELEVGGVHRDELLLAVAMAAGRASALPMDAEPPQNAQAPAVPDPAQAAAQGCLILVAEDNAINRKVIRHQLELLGLASELVASGQDALDCWRADPGRYGLLLTDLHMPGLDGFALAAAIRREEPTGQRLPIIASTANVQGMDAARCREVGMDACMSKPVALDVLNDTLRHWLGRGKTGAGPVAMTAPPPPAVAAVSAPRGDAALHGFDDSALTRLVGPDDAFQLDLCQRYLDSLDQALDDIGRAIASEDWRAAGLVAHRLRTSTLALGAVGLGRVFEAMEIAGRENDAQALRQQALWLGPAADTVRRHLRRQ